MERLTDNHIKMFLEQAPIYTWCEYKKPQVNRASLHINEIEAYCENCQQSRPFQDFRSRGSGAGFAVEAVKTGNSYFEFSCVSCRKETHYFHVRQIVDEETIKLQKYGEFPRKLLDRDKVLQKFFKEDSEYYEKAIICLANGYGIASFAYFRRILENNISRLLDLLLEDAESTDQNEEIRNAIGELKNETPMSNKIKIANSALPQYLKPDGLNPLGKLYQILSEGVHTYSDKECLQKAVGAKECIRFLIGELTSRHEHRSRFKSMVGRL